MKDQILTGTSLFTDRLPQPHAQAAADRIAVGKVLRQPTPHKQEATWAMAYLGRLMKEFHESVKCEPLISAGAPLDHVPEKAGTND
jgi:hypothetical protein